MKKTIRKYNYKNSEWRLKRLEVFKRDNNTCTKCNSNNNIQCHHTYYILGRKLHEYPLNCFLTLCGKCHTEFHKVTKGTQLVIRNKKLLLKKISEEKENGFSLEQKTIEKPIIYKTKKVKPKFKKSNNQIQREKRIPKKLKELEERRNRILVPQWKIDEYRKKII